MYGVCCCFRNEQCIDSKVLSIDSKVCNALKNEQKYVQHIRELSCIRDREGVIFSKNVYRKTFDESFFVNELIRIPLVHLTFPQRTDTF